MSHCIVLPGAHTQSPDVPKREPLVPRMPAPEVPLSLCNLATKPTAPSISADGVVYCSDGTVPDPALTPDGGTFDPATGLFVPAGAWYILLSGETVVAPGAVFIPIPGIALYDPAGSFSFSDGVNPGTWRIDCPQGSVLLGGACGIPG